MIYNKNCGSLTKDCEKKIEELFNEGKNANQISKTIKNTYSRVHKYLVDKGFMECKKQKIVPIDKYDFDDGNGNFSVDKFSKIQLFI